MLRATLASYRCKMMLLHDDVPGAREELARLRMMLERFEVDGDPDPMASERIAILRAEERALGKALDDPLERATAAWRSASKLRRSKPKIGGSEDG